MRVMTLGSRRTRPDHDLHVGTHGRPTRALIGRQREQRVVAELLAGMRHGRSAVLVIRGEPGIGKTALLDDVLRLGADLRVITLSGAESEMELAYAGVQQLCAPFLDDLDELPDPQNNAIQVALGLRAAATGAAPDPLLVGLALLTLLGEAAGERPIVCVVDDAQWVDAASLDALGLVARRLMADPIAMFFAARHLGADRQLNGLPELELGGLDDADARVLLGEMVPGRWDERVRENLLAESGGNPLALLELHRALDPMELAGGYGLANATSRASRISSSFERRLRELPASTVLLMLIAASESAGRSDWLWAAADRLGLDASAAQPAEEAGLITVFNGIRFRHPLIRSAVYRSAPISARRRVHGALAQVITDAAVDEHRAWHAAQAAARPDEQIATDLVLAAERARSRGGVAAAAAFLSLSAELTPDPELRVERRLDAANAKLDAGAPAAASDLMVSAAAENDAEHVGARIALLRAKLAFAINRGRDAPSLLLTAAERLARVDPPLARETYLEALMVAIALGRLPDGGEHRMIRSVAEAARSAPVASEPPRAVDLLLNGLVVRLTDGYVAAAPLLRRALQECLREDSAEAADPRWHYLTHRVCLDLFDRETSNTLAARQIESLRAAGELNVLPTALYQYAGLCITDGLFDQAADLVAEAETIMAATGAPPLPSIRPYLAAYRGQEELCRTLLQSAIDEATIRGQGGEVTVALAAKAILHNSLGQYGEALQACTDAAQFDDTGYYGYVLVEMIEAATRCGKGEVAAEALARLTERADAGGTDTARGLAARSAALVAGDDPSAEALYESAIELLKHSYSLYAVRTRLVYGEWLRRVRRRRDARVELRISYDSFVALGVEGFADRARRELTVAGETVSARPAGQAVELTAQESHIARLARDGHTTSEIAGQLFLSPRTVEWHLSRIFGKLGITSRRDLRNVEFDSAL
jgi:DNA-binding CsgD family transcriptional regulator/tetratricopeptide (TPR) repeat protein